MSIVSKDMFTGHLFGWLMETVKAGKMAVARFIRFPDKVQLTLFNIYILLSCQQLFFMLQFPAAGIVRPAQYLDLLAFPLFLLYFETLFLVTFVMKSCSDQNHPQ
jgi:hypothetical protein